jgi:copper transport protein
MGRRAVVAAIAALAVSLGGWGTASAWAHAGLVASDPAAGAALGAAPASVRLTFSERPAASLSELRLRDSHGAPLRVPSPKLAAGDPLSLVVVLPPLGRGVYTVSWRIVSAVDGHATSGVFAFGVRQTPTGAQARATSTTPGGSGVEFAGRLGFIVGLVALLGAAIAGVARFGGRAGAEVRLAATGWLLAVAGLVVLLVAQRHSAGVSLGELLHSAVGEALIWRTVAVVAAGLALAAAWRWRLHPRRQRKALAAMGVAAAAAVAIHVAAGHAGAGTWPGAISVGSQWAHFTAAGVWVGGLAALLLGLRGAASAEKAAAVRSFSLVATGAIVVVALAGTLRAIDELASWDDLVSGAYGRAVLVKIALIVLIAGIAARSRRRAVPRAASDLGPLRRASYGELSLAAAALIAAAVLGTVAPPISAGAADAPGLSATGSDAGTTVRVRLTTTSAQPGANQFDARVTDRDSGDPVRAARVRLRFEPLDDPDVDATSLTLRPTGAGSYGGTGPNLAFDGRWRVTVLVQRARDAVEVPLQLDVPGPEHFISVRRTPGRPIQYTAQVTGAGYVRITADPQRAGPSTVTVEVFTVFEDVATVDDLVLTAGPRGGRQRQRPVRLVSRGRFSADVNLVHGTNTIAVVAHDPKGIRVRAQFDVDVP